jgi:hypothetical protein
VGGVVTVRLEGSGPAVERVVGVPKRCEILRSRPQYLLLGGLDEIGLLLQRQTGNGVNQSVVTGGTDGHVLRLGRVRNPGPVGVGALDPRIEGVSTSRIAASRFASTSTLSGLFTLVVEAVS